MEKCAINFNPRHSVHLEAFALSCSRSGTNPEWPKYPKHDAHPEYLVHRQRGRLCLVQISLSLPQLTEYFGSGNYRVGRLRTADDSVDGDGLEFLRGGDAQARYFKRIKKKTRGNFKSSVSFILMLLYSFIFRSIQIPRATRHPCIRVGRNCNPQSAENFARAAFCRKII